MKNKLFLTVLLIALMAAAYGFTQRDSAPADMPHAHDEAVEGEDESVEISAEAAANAGIEVAEAGRAEIQQRLPLNGRVTLNEHRTARIKARFPGIIRAVEKQIGDVVAKGDVLAKVEGNESLITYAVKSPIAGVVLERNANLGDMAGDTPIFVVSDISELWAELFIFSKDAAQIQPNQTVRIHAQGTKDAVDTTIMTLLPQAELASQTIVARANLPNPSQRFRAGMTVQGDVVVSAQRVAVAVATTALQRVGNETVVFVQQGNRYSPRPVQVGMQDNDWVEITSGLEPGERYVAKNSFAVKADLGKRNAEHEH